MAVDDGVDLLGRGRVADGQHVIADLGDAHGAALGGDAVDGVAGVVFARGGVGLEPGVEPLACELADEDQGIGDRAIGSVGIGHAMQGDGHLVEVALPVDAGGVDELLILGHALGRLQVLVEEGAEGAEVDVNDAVGLGQQARGFGGSLGAQKDGDGQQDHDPGDDEERSTRASMHKCGEGPPKPGRRPLQA